MSDISGKAEDYKQAFSLFDADNDGSINHTDLANMMNALGENCSEQDVKDMIAEVAVPPSRGTIELNDFLFIMERRQEQSGTDDIKAAFDVFDPNGSGSIGVTDMQRVLKNLGEDVTEAEAAQIIKDISNGDTINIDQFRKMVR